MGTDNFEKSMTKLEQIVAKLEKGDLSLDEMLASFEEGIKLSKDCAKMLDEAEKRVNILLKTADGELTKQEFTQGE